MCPPPLSSHSADTLQLIAKTGIYPMSVDSVYKVLYRSSVNRCDVVWGLSGESNSHSTCVMCVNCNIQGHTGITISWILVWSIDIYSTYTSQAVVESSNLKTEDRGITHSLKRPYKDFSIISVTVAMKMHELCTHGGGLSPSLCCWASGSL